MRVILTGASGQFGVYLLQALQKHGVEVFPWSGTDVGERVGLRLRPIDLTRAGETEEALDRIDAGLIIHTAAIASPVAVHHDPARGAAVNVAATAHLADWCARNGRRLVFTSTDMVFDGTKAWSR